MKVDFNWYPGDWVQNDMIARCAALYSEHYGIWSNQSPVSPGRRIRRKPEHIRELLASRDSSLAIAELNGSLIGYAIAVQTRLPRYGVVSWVSQLVVHEAHRRSDIAKRLLFSIWGFSDHFAWGLISANPYAIRALEKATRRRCVPKRISKHASKLMEVGEAHVPYVQGKSASVDSRGARVNSQFFVDHSTLPDKLRDVTSDDRPWLLGNIEEGWEWFAFTFRDQKQISLSKDEMRQMLATSDQITQQAYGRMTLDASHSWAKYTDVEADRIVEFCKLSPGMHVLDLGCGLGRHVMALARRGMNVLGVDYVGSFIERANNAIGDLNRQVQFLQGDCRDIAVGRQFDAVISLYDVVGTYADDAENLRILQTIARHLSPAGLALISVMNFEPTEKRAKHFFSLDRDPDKLLSLPASTLMETTGNIFNPDYYMIETESKVVYRKEQFASGGQLPVELIVRDRRFLSADIERLCAGAGLEVEWMRHVRAGSWDTSLDPHDERAKEILLLCKRRQFPVQAGRGLVSR